MKNKIQILVANEIATEHLKILTRSKFFIDINTGLTNSEILNLKKKYKVLIIRSTRKLDKSFLQKCNFEIIATCSRGTDHIDVEFAQKRNIKIINSEYGNIVSTAEHTIALILEIYKRIIYADKLVRSGNFENTNFPRYELKDKKIGIIGIGKVGSYVAKLAGAFGMKIFANDIDMNVRRRNPQLNFKSLKYLITNSDIVTVHIPLNKFNKIFFSDEKLKLLNRKSVLINTSRGGIMDEKYLLKLLREKKIFFAGLDVFHNEPHINPGFYSLDNVILTNHIAGKSFESKECMIKEILLQVKKYYIN
jgi:D-3-phosphoglycerate dehydrogenase / 2-oxoglutarate reductase